MATSLRKRLLKLNSLLSKYAMWGFLCGEVLLSVLIVKKIPYTEIDWKAYMEEVELYVAGERDYTKIQGNTGPLVYPAGFLYIFSALRDITSKGVDILTAQYIFVGFYLLTLLVTFRLYQLGGLESYTMIPLTLSKRIHSIFMLRMFNDCIALLFGYIAIYMFCKRQWRIGSVLYSLGVSVKMNMLLFAPGILAIYLLHIGYMGAIENIVICALVQLILGWPFLTTYPVQYINKSFELGRVFFHKWTVNYKFLSEEMFLNKWFSTLLLLLTVLAYAVFTWRWTSQFCKGYRKSANEDKDNQLQLTARSPSFSKYISCRFLIYTAFTSNVIGIIFARSLHYQFYCWYFHTLPFLLFQTSLHWLISTVMLVCIEVSFNVYPATWWSSAMLQACHLILLFALYYSPIPREEGESVGESICKDNK